MIFVATPLQVLLQNDDDCHGDGAVFFFLQSNDNCHIDGAVWFSRPIETRLEEHKHQANSC
jgi:hypothetical protein